MRQCISRFLNDKNYAISWTLGSITIFVFLLSILAIFVMAYVTSLFDRYDYAESTITVSGTGEVVAVPDVANFSFSVDITAESMELAQSESAKKSNEILDFIKEQGVEEKDIKTTGYNLNPKYEYIPCRGFDCADSGQKLVGYQANQTVQVKVRETENAGNILAGVTSRGATNISGLQFAVDDTDALKEESRSLAVSDAKKQAEKLAKDLGVKLKDVISFNENGNGPFIYESYGGEMMMDSAVSKAVAPNIAVGENTITTTVSVTYEID